MCYNGVFRNYNDLSPDNVNMFASITTTTNIPDQTKHHLPLLLHHNSYKKHSYTQTYKDMKMYEATL